MRSIRTPRRLGLALVLLAAPIASTAGPGAVDADAYVAAHDRVRSEAVPRPVPALPPMRWSDELARSAARWARACRFENSITPGVGENLYISTGHPRVERPDPATVVDSWAAERASYDYATNRCRADCLHYTQLVWRDSVEVGCAVARCTPDGGHPNPIAGFARDDWYSVVCHYAPPGNFRGERPYSCDRDGDGDAREPCG